MNTFSALPILGLVRASCFSLCLASAAIHAQTVTNGVVGTCCSDYQINSQPDPILTLTRGVTYVFTLSTAGHPFYLKTNSTTGAGDQYTDGVTGNGGQSGVLIFAVPTNAPNTLFYHCGIHGLMGNQINIVTPPSPPTVKIVFVSIGSNIVVQSTGATNWSAVPEFKCDAMAAVWSNVASFTNVFINGTNTTTFDRLDAICGPNTFIRIRNQSN